jgi:hypothetical protein
MGRGRVGKHMLPPRRRGPGLPPISSPDDTFSEQSSRYSGSGRQNSSRLSVVSEDEAAKLAAESLVEHLKNNQGFSLKKDGTIFSCGSSMTPDRGTDERYIDPETAAKSVIESLESMGYSYDINDGVKEMESGSTNEASERYRMSKAYSEDSRSTRKSKGSKGTKDTTDSKESKSTKESSAKESKTIDSKSTKGSKGTKESKSKDSKNSKESKGTKESSAKESMTKDSKSTEDSGTKATNLGTISSKEELDLLTRIESGSQSESAFDESTISTKDSKLGGILKRPKAAVPEVQYADMSKVEDTAQTVEKKVEWAGEMPPPTSSGARVPELVKSFPLGVLPNMSDLTSIQHTVDSASYPDITNLTEDRIERFFEQFFLSCRLALHQPKA